MSERDDEVLALLKQLTESTNRALQSHAVALQLLNDNLVAAHQAAQGQAKALELHAVALQNHKTTIESHAKSILVLWEEAGLPLGNAPPEPPPGPVN